jgi:hypothetical protein
MPSSMQTLKEVKPTEDGPHPVPSMNVYLPPLAADSPIDYCVDTSLVLRYHPTRPLTHACIAIDV